MPSVHLVGLGCDKNTVDGEFILGEFVESGYTITNNPNEADIIIINTCCFIQSATEESINTILSFLDYKDKAKIVVTGCLAERYKDELEKEIPEIDYIVTLKDQNEIINLFSETKETIFPKRYNTTGKVAYLKISEGCNRNCSYCIIPKLRGRYRSFEIKDLLKQARELSQQGVTELILVAQDLTQYGTDLENTTLVDLLKALEELDFKWIRLLYLYPEGIDEDLLNYIKDSEVVLPYFDIPIQHTSEKILKKMGRYISKGQIFELVERIRKLLPQAVLRSTVIVGFPGESEEDFNTLLEDLEKLKFDRLGAFSYSREEGTKAFDFSDQLSDEVKEHRLEEVNKHQQKIMREQNKRFLGQTLPVIIDEKIDDQTYEGRFFADAPDIDCVVYVNTKRELEIGEIVDVVIIDALDYEFIGDLNESS